MKYEFSDSLDKKVRQAILLIRHAYRHATWQDKKLEVAVSGGKDSDVVIQLCRMADVWGKDGLRPIHKCTTIDPAGTLRHVAEQGVEIVRPRKDFAHCILTSGLPNMYVRHCCGELKEYAIEDYVLLGIRRCESVKRSKNYKEPTQCVAYKRGGTVEQYYPILEWTDKDIEEFVNVTGIRLHPLYYDGKGMFHVERRLGCMGCPLQYRKKRVEDFKRHPRMLRFYVRYGAQYLREHPDVKPAKMYRDVYEWLVCDLFFKDYNAFKEADYQPQEAKKRLEEYFSINL